jgi:dihydrolipoamide dehydrogenase
MVQGSFDLVVIGGGVAGYTAAISAIRHGLRPLLVEKGEVGGVCLHRGCIPTKALLEGAGALAAAQRWGFLCEPPNAIWDRLQQAKERAVAQAHRDLLRLLEKHRVPVARARARLLGPRRVALSDGRQVEARWVVLATGSRPRQLPGLPIDGRRILTSDHLLSLPSPPSDLLIVGGGAVGLEFASLFLDLGVRVKLVEVMPRLLPSEDEEVSQGLRRALERRGAQVFTKANLVPEATIPKEEGVEVTVEVKGEPRRLKVSHVLVAVGRVGNVEDLGLESTAVQVKGGFIAVDDRLRTAQGDVYAVGDVAGAPLLAHKAAAEAAAAVADMVGLHQKPLDRRCIPRVVYTRPQVAAVGLTVEEAVRTGLHVRARRLSLRINAMAALRGEQEGFIKLVYDADTGQVLGVHTLGPQAEELIGEAALAMEAGIHVQQWAQVVHPHPSIAETLGEVVRMAHGSSILL